MAVSDTLADAITSTEKGYTYSPNYAYVICCCSSALDLLVSVWNGLEGQITPEMMLVEMGYLKIALNMHTTRNIAGTYEITSWGTTDEYRKAENGPPSSGNWVYDKSDMRAF